MWTKMQLKRHTHAHTHIYKKSDREFTENLKWTSSQRSLQSPDDFFLAKITLLTLIKITELLLLPKCWFPKLIIIHMNESCLYYVLAAWIAVSLCRCIKTGEKRWHIFKNPHWFLQRSIICSIHGWCFICIAGHAKSISAWASSQRRKHELLNLNQRMFENSADSHYLNRDRQGWRGRLKRAAEMWDSSNQCVELCAHTPSHQQKHIQHYRNEGERKRGEERRLRMDHVERE